MPKCSCAGSACNCNITVGDGLTVSGTGNANSPFIISLNSQHVPVAVPANGPIDISGVQSGSVVYLNLSGNVTGLTLPNVLGIRFDIVVWHTVAGTTITFPNTIHWADNAAPAQATAAGRADWYTLRYVGDFWIGAVLSTNAY